MCEYNLLVVSTNKMYTLSTYNNTYKLYLINIIRRGGKKHKQIVRSHFHNILILTRIGLCRVEDN